MSSFLSTKELLRLNSKAITHLSSQDYQSSKKILELALSSPELSSSLKVSLLCNLSCVFNNLKEHKQALDCLVQALSIKKKLSSSHIIGALFNLAVTLSFRNNHLASIKYYIKALKKLEFEKHCEIRAVIYYNIAVEYFFLKRSDKAMEYFRTGWAFSHSVPENAEISKLLLLACTNFLPVISEVSTVMDISKPRHVRSRTLINTDLTSPADSVPCATPRASNKSMVSGKFLRPIRSLTETSPISGTLAMDSSVTSPKFLNTSGSKSELFGYTCDYLGKVENLRTECRNYKKHIEDFMLFCRKVAKRCYCYDSDYYHQATNKILFLQKHIRLWCHTRERSAVLIQRSYLKYKAKLLYSQPTQASTQSMRKYKPKLHPRILRSVLKSSLPN